MNRDQVLDSHKKQKIEDGTGPAYHRVYTIDLPVPVAKARRMMEKLKKDPNPFSPQALATFDKVSGSEESLNVGDEFQIRISGPWNGPVRVVDVDDDSFRFATLEGHMEAGEIEFRVRSLGENASRFEIESLARSRDRLVDLVFDKLPIAKFAQTEMWTLFCQEFARQTSGDEKVPEVNIITERQNPKTAEWERI